MEKMLSRNSKTYFRHFRHLILGTLGTLGILGIFKARVPFGNNIIESPPQVAVI
jgi:hypothetical protein